SDIKKITYSGRTWCVNMSNGYVVARRAHEDANGVITKATTPTIQGNCSDQIDYKMMGKLFRGLAQSGSWTCLDEFNRIDIEVLSVIAQQLLVLREGRIAKKRNINFMGVEINLLDHHVIITMNPGYAGRTELPDNLQVCFRPVAMMVPNYALIAEIMLFAEGFGDAKTLSRKMCKLYILCSEQLSQQPHYDYGLRAVKSVLVMAGGLKRGNPETPEDLVLIRALRDSNLPKFLAFDIPLFFAILADLFPGVTVPNNDYGEFQTVMCEEINKAGLQNISGFHAKVIQMFDILNIRFGATLVGPTGAGKSTCYRILAATMGTLFRSGSKNTQFQEVGDETPVRKWTVFDGPIDALWIENMNTVLDDNMTLCLANGERIKLKVEMKMLFEVMDLAAASPATVSRIGVVFMTPSDLGWMPYVHSWAQKLPSHVPDAARTHVVALFEKFFQDGLNHQRKHLKEPVGCVDIQLATSCAVVFQAIFAGTGNVNFEAYNKTPDLLLRLVEKIWFFAFNWAVGGSITSDGHEKFDEFARGLIETSGVNLMLPNSGTTYDCFVQINDSGGTFTPWKSIVPAFNFDPTQPYTAIVVPTEDTTRFSFLMRTLITESKPVFLTGVTGTGKTVMVQNTLKSLEPLVEDGGLGVVSMFLNFSAQTSSLVTQQSIEAKLEKKRKNLLGAPAGRKIIVMVDDVNMPLVETYGAQPPIELLRQFLDFKGFYDRDKLFWKDIVDTMLFTGAAPPGGGRSEVTPRFSRHFNVLCVPPASEGAMGLIFESIFGGFMASFDKTLQCAVKGIVAGTIEIYNTIAKELLPTPSRFHYSFNLRDLSKVFQGLLMVTPQKVKDMETLAKLWLHETQRVFYDRLINVTDQAWFESLGCELLARHLAQPPHTPEQLFGDNSVIFADFGKPGVDVANRKYEFVEQQSITHVLSDMLDDYNVNFPTKMNLVFFSDAVRHICRMCRIIRQPRGNAMLVGVGGSGKQSTARLAAFVANMPCLSIEINRGYGLKEFREDMKKFMIMTVGDALRVRCRQFPSLINCSTIDWYLGWPGSALVAVASHFLSSVKLGSGSEELETQHRESIVQLCVKVHLSIGEMSEEFFAKLRRRTYTTPKSYLDLINMYSTKLGELQARVDVKIEQMTVGTQKLSETNAIVDGLRGELKQLEPVLVEKKAAAEKMLNQVAIDQAEADKQKEKVSTEEATLSKQSQEVAAVAAEAQADLDVALPALNAAVKALDSLTKNDITEVKAFKSPPLAVKVTMEGICIMLERKPDWDEAKKVLGDSDFLNKLKTYDKDNIKDSVIKKIQKYITDQNMQVDVVTKVSQAAKGLCMWIHAMNVYHKVAKEVAPKRERVNAMNEQLAKANASLKEKQDTLQAVLDKVAALQEQCDNTVDEKQELEAAQEQTSLRLTNAEKLTSGLSSEGIRWKANLEAFSVQRVTLIGDTLLSCAAISYYGPFTGAYRDRLMNMWLEEAKRSKLPCSESPTLLTTLSMAADRKKLAELEAEILKRLSESKGNILDDEDLIDTLADSKSFSTMINERLEAAEVTQKEIHEAREEYRSVATRGALLYFVIADLSLIDPMYAYSLQYFSSLFTRCLRDAEPCADLASRLQTLVSYSTEVIYANICRGLFEHHKALFSALLAFSILRHAKVISSREWNLLIRGAGVGADKTSQQKNPHADKINEQAWDLICAMEHLPTTSGDFKAEGNDVKHILGGLAESLATNWKAWQRFMEAEQPHEEPLPEPFDDRVTPFGKLLLVKALRDDKVLLAINGYVRAMFGDALADSPSATMEQIYADLDNATPCIFILSKGSDPTSLLFKLAKSRSYSDRLHLVSLGQGQGPAARALVERGCRTGDWALLQNCMLAKSWMGDLELMVFELQENREKTHQDFRLFLTSSPADYFPVSVLQNGVKMTNEPPKGIRANLLRSYANLVNADDFESNSKPAAFKRLTSSLCFFHANVLERRKFGPLGWNIRYAFDESDLETSIAILNRFLNEQEDIPWDALRFVVGHINYGGRVTDDWDRRCLLTILGTFFHELVLEKNRADDDYAAYTFSKSGIYHPASTGDVASHKAYFDSLPSVDNPEFFGMHENANRSFNRTMSSALVASILQLQPRESSSGAGKSSDEVVLDVIADIQAKLPAQLDEDDAGKQTFIVQENGLLTPLDTVLKQEIVKFNRLLSRMASSLVELHKAINGFVTMSSDLDHMYTAFLQNTLPPIWSNVSFASLKTLASWVKDVIFRVDFMKFWLLDGLPASFPLPVFFFPQGFMTGTLQTYARKYQVAIDTLQFKFASLTSDLPNVGPDDGVYVSGLYMEGARWDFDDHLVRESKLGEMFVPMPVIHFQPAVGHKTPDGWYACPVYKTAERKGVLSTTGMSTNFVVAVELPTSVDPSAWVLAGVACLCNLTD
ncbi:hypothetical protein CTAYLR_006023, partial [Chrysophaeum taylorii]